MDSVTLIVSAVLTAGPMQGHPVYLDYFPYFAPTVEDCMARNDQFLTEQLAEHAPFCLAAPPGELCHAVMRCKEEADF